MLAGRIRADKIEIRNRDASNSFRKSSEKGVDFLLKVDPSSGWNFQWIERRDGGVFGQGASPL
jgi:hypothetical protein